MIPCRWLVPAAGCLVTSSALAAGPASLGSAQLIQPRALVQPFARAAARQGLAAEFEREPILQLTPTALSLPLLSEAKTSGPDEVRTERLQPRSRAQRSSPSKKAYQELLEDLVITQDFCLPGFETMGLRLIPTRTALVGETVPIVFRPRLIGSSWVGVDIAASF